MFKSETASSSATIESIKSRLVQLKKEQDELKGEMKRAKEQAKIEKEQAKLAKQSEKPSKASRSTRTSSDKPKSKSKSASQLTSDQLAVVVSVEWTSALITKWTKENLDNPTDSYLKDFLKKISIHYDQPKCGDRTITSAIKPSLTKWAADVSSEEDEDLRDSTLHKIQILTGIVDLRRDALKLARSNAIPTEETEPSLSQSIHSQEENDMMSSQVITSSQIEADNEEDLLSLSHSLSNLTLTPSTTEPPVFPIRSLTLTHSSPTITLEEPIEEEEEEEDAEDAEEEEEEEDAPRMLNTTKSFRDLFSRNVMECTEFTEFVIRKAGTTRCPVTKVLYKNNIIASSTKDKWVFNVLANIPLSEINEPDEEDA